MDSHFRLETGHVGHITHNCYIPGIISIAVLPINELITCIRISMDLDYCTIIVGTATCCRSHSFITAKHLNLILINGESGNISGIARHRDGTRIAGITIVPADKMVVCCRIGNQLHGSACRIGTTTCNSTHSIIGGYRCDGVSLWSRAC